MTRGENFSQNQCPKNDLERNQIKDILYAYVVESLLYTQAYTKPYISFAIAMLDRYKSNPRMEY